MDNAAGTRRLLVAGIGNIFYADDGFGVEVVRRLATASLPAGVRVVDFGIRGLHLAYEMMDGGYDQVILVDALPQNAPAGTIAVVEAGLTASDTDEGGPEWDAHSMHPAAVLRLVQRIGGSVPNVLVVGCEPARLDENIGLSPVVAAAVDEAAQLVLQLVAEEEDARVSRNSGADRRTQP
jgi:hydrogenase maturation protease